jgi:hypothetical protein
MVDAAVVFLAVFFVFFWVCVLAICQNYWHEERLRHDMKIAREFQHPQHLHHRVDPPDHQRGQHPHPVAVVVHGQAQESRISIGASQ